MYARYALPLVLAFLASGCTISVPETYSDRDCEALFRVWDEKALECRKTFSVDERARRLEMCESSPVTVGGDLEACRAAIRAMSCAGTLRFPPECVFVAL